MNKDKLIEAQEQYIELLEEELGKMGWVYVTRPYTQPSEEKVNEGVNLRDLIKEAKEEEEDNKYTTALLSIYDTLILHDTGALCEDYETLSEMFFRKLSAYDVDLNKELGFTHLKPIKKND
jgi:hypothetical protein